MERKEPENKKTPSRLVKFYHKLLLIPLGLILLGFGFLFFLYFKIEEYPLDNGNLNFLVLGASGGIRTGQDLTDTMILVNVDFERERLFLISLPRDLWDNPLKIKINAAYHYGGFPLANSLVGEITGVKPAFSLLLDFQGFKEAVDLVGGVEIEIERTFDDFRYPREDEEGKPITEGEIYEHVHFEKGRQLMDGEQALKYARSRHSEDLVEGTDGARSLRQQKVLLAFKEKALSPRFLFNFSRVNQMVGIARRHLITDLPRERILGLVKLGIRLVKIRKTTNLALGNEAQKSEILTSPLVTKYDQWVLEPRTGDWQEIRDLVAKILKDEQK